MKTPNTTNTVGSVDDLANIYGWHTDKCMGNIHSADCPVLKLKQIIQTLQQQAKAEERGRIRQKYNTVSSSEFDKWINNGASHNQDTNQT